MSVLALLAAAVLQAGAGVVPLAEAEQALYEGRFDDVRARATAALSLPLSEEERVRAFELLGTAEAAFGREEEALQAFRRLLWHAPDHRLPEQSSPKLVALLAQAREAGALAPAMGPEPTLPVGPPGFVRAALTDAPSAAMGADQPLWGQWWFWALAGGVGLGAGAAAWQLSRPELARGSLGRERLQ